MIEKTGHGSGAKSTCRVQSKCPFGKGFDGNTMKFKLIWFYKKIAKAENSQNAQAFGSDRNLFERHQVQALPLSKLFRPTHFHQ